MTQLPPILPGAGARLNGWSADGIQDWLPKWKLNNWRTAAKKTVANKELWEQLDSLCQTHHTSWEWVKGHSGHPMNERCDALASVEAAKIAAS